MSMAFSDSSAPEPARPTATGRDEDLQALIETYTWANCRELFRLAVEARNERDALRDAAESNRMLYTTLGYEAGLKEGEAERDHLRALLREARTYIPLGPPDLLAEIAKALGERE